MMPVKTIKIHFLKDNQSDRLQVQSSRMETFFKNSADSALCRIAGESKRVALHLATMSDV